jgi:hypothetical protein
VASVRVLEPEGSGPADVVERQWSDRLYVEGARVPAMQDRENQTRTPQINREIMISSRGGAA